nr:prealbumin-like fold domain-containing protein [Anaerococcus prevotii]
MDAQYKKVDTAYKELSAKYEFVDGVDADNVVTLTSNVNSKRAIEDLAGGTYFLQETNTHEGYAKLTRDFVFKVGENSWNTQVDIDFAKDKDG